ncbi:MAG: hypothetical protein R3E32_15920 [Chitinophagales bacterium]
MNYLPCLILLLSLQLSLSGQQNTALPQPELALKIAPLPLIDIFGGNAGIVSLEVGGMGRTAISLEMGLLYHSIGYGLQNNRGWILGIEWRQYFKKQAHRYIAVSCRYKSQQYEFTETIDIPNVPTYEKDNAYTKQISTLSVLYGWQKVKVDKRFFVDAYAGLGIKYKDTMSLELTKMEESNRDNGDSQVLSLLNSTGKHLIPNPALGFRLGYLLK